MPQIATSTTAGCVDYQVRTRVVGREGLEAQHFRTEDLLDSLQRRFPNISMRAVGGTAASVLETYHWDTGEEDLKVLLQAMPYSFRVIMHGRGL